MSSLGDKILTEITKQGMVTLVEPKYEGTLVFAWAANFADQIEAVIAKHLAECVHPDSKISTLGSHWLWCSECGSVRRTLCGEPLGRWQSPDLKV